MSPTAVPFTPAKIIEPSTFTCASPARKWPISAMAKLKILSVMPTVFIRLPARMKNGTARSEALSTPSSTCSGTM